MMASKNEVVWASDNQELSVALGCSEDTIESMRGMGFLESVGEFWNLGPAREYLRDAAWADQLWQ